MKKFNEFCEEYEASLWQLCAAIWFFVEYFCNRDVWSRSFLDSFSNL